jgi:FixJ family two-component response regulator
MGDSHNLIAIVEDDFGMREALTRMLKAAGFEARGYASAEDYLETESPRARCLVVDIHLPGASSIDLQRRLSEDGEACPVVFITAHDSPRLRREAEALGAIAFLAKPFEGRLLLDAVGEVLGRENKKNFS